MHSAIRKALATVSNIPATASVVLIRLYQRTLSPDHGLLHSLYPYGFCRHHPTCSQYAIETLKSRSYPVAVFLSIKRLLSCHPWTKVSNERLRQTIERSM
ncbi:MAG: membrane protein insertion efficiency factor YidD [Candidatus Peribacteraceae bacterium]